MRCREEGLYVGVSGVSALRRCHVRVEGVVRGLREFGAADDELAEAGVELGLDEAGPVFTSKYLFPWGHDVFHFFSATSSLQQEDVLVNFNILFFFLNFKWVCVRMCMFEIS